MATAKKGGEKPKWKPAEAIRRGSAALELARDNRARIESRLPAGAIDGLEQDIKVIQDKIDLVAVHRSRQKGYTASQNKLMKHTRDFVSALKEAIKTAHPRNKSLLKAIGVGNHIVSRKVTSVTAAADTLLKAAARFPEEFRAAGVLERDLQKLDRLRSSLQKVDVKQEQVKVTAKQAIAARNEAQLRIERMVGLIARAGEIEFMEDPEKARAFAGITKGTGKKGKAAKAKKAKKAGRRDLVAVQSPESNA